jgi:hypothetical protein
MVDPVHAGRIRRGHRLLGFALGTFRLLLLGWVFVFLGYRTGRLGEGLDDVGTGLGLLLSTIAWTTVGAIGWIAILRLSSGTSTPTTDILMRAIEVGAIAGAIVAAPVALLAAFTTPPIGLVIGAVGVAVAALVGASLALVFALVDIALLALARWAPGHPR